MLIVTPARRAPWALVVCRAIVSNAVTAGVLVALATVAAGVLLRVPELVAMSPEAAVAIALGFGMPLGLVHGVAQLLAAGGAPPERPDAAARTAATAVAAVPVTGFVLAASADPYLFWLAGLAFVQGALAWYRAPRWVAWRGPHRSG